MRVRVTHQAGILSSLPLEDGQLHIRLVQGQAGRLGMPGVRCSGQQGRSIHSYLHWGERESLLLVMA